MKWSVIYLKVACECSEELCEVARKHEGRPESSVSFSNQREGFEFIFNHAPNAYAFLNELWKFQDKVEIVNVSM